MWDIKGSPVLLLLTPCPDLANFSSWVQSDFAEFTELSCEICITHLNEDLEQTPLATSPSVNSGAVTGLLTQHDVILLDLWLFISILSEPGLPLPPVPHHITALTILLPNGVFNLLLPAQGQAVFLRTFLTATPRWMRIHPSDSEQLTQSVWRGGRRANKSNSLGAGSVWNIPVQRTRPFQIHACDDSL